MSVLLSVDGLGVRFGDLEAVREVSFQVSRGEFVAIIGPSGCGKSTVLRAMAGLLVPEAEQTGRVEAPRRSDGRRDVAWMPQRDALLPWRRARANALIGARIAGMPPQVASARAAELFERFGLSGFERAWPHELSGGMRQRLALARTVLADRQVLLLDEPFGALDALTRRSMNDWLADQHLAASGAVVLVTHDVDEALRLADRVLVMSARPGRIVHESTVRPAVAGHLDDDAARRVLLAALSSAAGG